MEPLGEENLLANYPETSIRSSATYVSTGENEIPDHDVFWLVSMSTIFDCGSEQKNALGRPHGFECATQGTLFFDVARIIAAKAQRLSAGKRQEPPEPRWWPHVPGHSPDPARGTRI